MFKLTTTEKNLFGVNSIDYECFEKIYSILPEQSTILELGSGYTSSILSKYYNVYSVEHDMVWLNKAKTNYIYAPLVKQKNFNTPWYDTNILKKQLPSEYNLILIDGPPAGLHKEEVRHGFYYNIDIFKVDNCIIIFDDIQRPGDLKHLKMVSEKLEKPYSLHFSNSTPYKKGFGIIY
jgi:hypothetical protein